MYAHINRLVYIHTLMLGWIFLVPLLFYFKCLPEAYLPLDVQKNP